MKSLKLIITTLLILCLGMANAEGQTRRGQTIELNSRHVTRIEAMRSIQQQAGYIFGYSSVNFNGALVVDFGSRRLALNDALNRIVDDSGCAYSFDDNFILIYPERTNPSESQITVLANCTVSGTVKDAGGGITLNDVKVELIDLPSVQAVTNQFGRFTITQIPAGNHIVKLTSADRKTVRYREINVSPGSDAEVTLVLNGELMQLTETIGDENKGISTAKTTNYFVSNQTDHTIRALSDEMKTELFFVPTTRVQKNYLPKVGIKTNLLYLATTTPNVAVEFGLAPKWTLDIAAGLNPWTLNDRNGGIRHGLIQPEARYWFCQRFEKHFIGLHGIYGDYQIADIDLAPFGNDLTGKRYDGWGVGAGISYGYHLPMSSRWSWEFTVGVGYIYLEYNQYNCGACDTNLGKFKKDYFGPTKAGISLIYMIK